MEVLKRSSNELTQISSLSSDYIVYKGDISQSFNNKDFLTIVEESDISVGENHEIYTTEEGNMISRTVPVNIINISDDQILRIEFQNDSNLQNTEFIIDDNVLQPSDFSNCELREVEIINETTKSEDFSSDNNENELLTAVQSLASYHDNVLSTSIPSPETDEDLKPETDLTSLNWLHNITNIMTVPNLPTPPISPPPLNSKKLINNSSKSSNNCEEDLTINIDFYKKNGDKKPPFSYATLICMAMSKNDNKMTLSAIYSWIRENFLYYRKAHPSWQVRFFKIYI